MRLAVHHVTRYRFAQPATHGLQRLRLRPRDCAVQQVVDWSLHIDGGKLEDDYVDHNGNHTMLVSFGGPFAEPGAHDVVITSRGVVETRDCAGVVGPHSGFMPLWLLTNQTPLTRPGPVMQALARRFAASGEARANTIEMLHALSEAVSEAVAYEKGATCAATSAEAAAAAGKGVCQDHAHVFIGIARALGVPARYVSGYLLMDEAAQEAGHAWAEAHVPGLGWVGFDVSNRLCPDSRYVRVAVGADYKDAAPVTSLALGGGECHLSVALEVAQQVCAQ